MYPKIDLNTRPKNKTAPAGTVLVSLFSFLVHGVLAAARAEFLNFQTVFKSFLIFTRKIIGCFALSTLKLNHVVL